MSRPTPGNTPKTGTASSTLGRLGLVVLSVPVFIVLSEFALWSLDLGRSAQIVDLSRGFDPGVTLLVPDHSERGAWRTNVFGDPQRERVIPARDGRRRVLLFGGSNTQVFPDRLLEEALQRSRPDPGWEVVNLGRQGYGTGRVRALLQQALVLEPDVVVIYAGHNEFVELAFLRELRVAWGAPWERVAATAASRLRLFGVVVGALRGARQPEPLVRPDHEARQLTWPQTLERYAAYEQNLADMCAAARAAGAQVIVCTLVSNLLAPPQVFTFSGGHDARDIAAFDALRIKALGRIPADCRAALRPPLRLRMHDWYDGPEQPAVAPDGGPAPDPAAPPEAWQPPPLRPLLDALAEAPAGDGWNATSIEGAHWPDPAGWDADVRAIIQSMAACLRPGLDEAGRSRLADANQLLRDALELVPDSPRAWFDLGLVAWLQGDDEGARDALGRAAELDRAPSSANRRVNGIVRAVAEREPGVSLLDAEALFAGRCPGGVVGYEVMMDSCHLQPGARVVLMDDLAAAILQLPSASDR